MPGLTKQVQRNQVSEEAVQRYLHELADRQDEVLRIPPIDGRLIEDVALVPFVDNSIEHKLDRVPRGYIVVKRSGRLDEFFAYRATSNQTVTTGTWTKIELNAELYDRASAYDPTTNFRWTAPYTGLFDLTASVGTSDTLPDGTRTLVAIRVNGLPIAYTDDKVGAAASDHVFQCSSGPIELNSGDYAEVWWYHAAGGDRNAIASSQETFLRGSVVDRGIIDRQSSNSVPEKTLILGCSYTQTVSLWVF